MDVVTTSLEALIQRATNPQNEKLDIAAIEAFRAMVCRENEGVQIAVKLIVSKIQSTIEWQSLQALTLLDTCMRRCGPLFMSEVGKFRFLNEMIKLVSPKYLGNSISISVREKVLTLLQEWTTNYPHEPKIKEAYEMLKKQGLVKNACSPITSSSEKISQPFRIKNPVFDDEEKSRILQKLLQSKNPDDLLAANKLIKSMVKEDERRAQRDSRRMMELESVHNNVNLLSDMLDSYLPAQTSTEDIELMKELYETCERLQPTIERLAQETLDNEIVLAEVVGASDDLEKVREKYTKILLYNQPSNSLNISMKTRDELLDLSSSSLTVCAHSEALNNEKDFNLPTHSQSNIELLGEIFGPSCNTTEIHLSDQPLLLSNPLVVQSTNNSNSNNDAVNKQKVHDDRSEMGEFLVKKSVFNDIKKAHVGSVSNSTSKVSHSCLTNQSEVLGLPKINDNYDSYKPNQEPVFFNNEKFNDDDALININIISADSEHELSKIAYAELESHHKKDMAQCMNVSDELKIKPLADINIRLESIQPGSIQPVTVIDEKNGVSVVLHFAKDSPRSDVSVIVVTTMSKNCKPLKNYLFQALLPKTCKCRLQYPSNTELPAYNPFLPPSAITQIMLIANPYKEVISLKFMLSYTMDGETITEMGEVDRLPTF